MFEFTFKDKLILICLTIISIVLIIFVNNNAFIYKNEILKIEKIVEKEIKTSTNPNGHKEKNYEQHITGTILNGINKNTKKKIINERSYSSVVTNKYKIGDEVFIKDKTIIDLKRDKYITYIFIVFTLSIFLIGKIKGLLAILSVLANGLIFYFGINLYLSGGNLLLLCILQLIIFAVISLFLSNGNNKKTYSAIISTLVSTTILFILALIIIKLTNYKGLNFNELEFLTVPFEDVFMVQLIIGGFGAVMDIAITMSSSVGELIEKNPKIKEKTLFKSGKEIGKDILGTMINVLFFTYMCSGLPLFVLATRNGFNIFNFISSNFSIEISRFLVGSIGIIIAIPISLYLSIKIIKRGDKHE